MPISKHFPTWRTLRIAVATLVITGVLAIAGAAAVMWSGWYDVSAIGQHWQASYSVLEWVKRQSVRRHAGGRTPVMTPAQLLRGAVVYREQCLQCHGAPGIAPHAIGLSMQPQPGPLVHMLQRWEPAEIYWIVSNGIKMSGMPAWRYRMSDSDLWAVTAMVMHLPDLSPQEYAVLQDSAQGAPGLAEQPVLRKPNAPRGKIAISQYACQSCHHIPGTIGGDVQVGPNLEHYGTRQYIAGYLPNTPANLARWLTSTHEVKPLSAMPQLGVSEADAFDIAAYLLDADQAK